MELAVLGSGVLVLSLMFLSMPPALLFHTAARIVDGRLAAMVSGVVAVSEGESGQVEIR